MKVKVSNFISSRSGRAVANQFIVYTDEGVYFQSYDSVIAFKPNGSGETVLDENVWEYSRTTGKYRNEFLGEGIAETRKKIESGEYVFGDLN